MSCSLSARKAGFDGAEADEINLVWPLDRVAIRAAAGCFAARSWHTSTSVPSG